MGGSGNGSKQVRVRIGNFGTGETGLVDLGCTYGHSFLWCYSDDVFLSDQVGPQAIYVVGRDDDDDDSVGGGSEVSDGAASWETVEDTEMENLDNTIEVRLFLFHCL